MAVAETTEFPGSSNLASATYDPDSETLTVEFRSGRSYDYFNVQPSTYRSLTLAGSAGEFFARHIRNRHSYQEA